MYDAQVVYVSGLERIEIDGTNLRAYLYEMKGGHPEPVLEIVCPASAFPDIIMKALCALTATGVAATAVPLMELTMQ